MFVERWVSSSQCQQKNDIILGGGGSYLGKNDITRGQADSTGMPPDQKVTKAEEHTLVPENFLHSVLQ
jgi:hypothetical protein